MPSYDDLHDESIERSTSGDGGYGMSGRGAESACGPKVVTTTFWNSEPSSPTALAPSHEAVAVKHEELACCESSCPRTAPNLEQGHATKELEPDLVEHQGVLSTNEVLAEGPDAADLGILQGELDVEPKVVDEAGGLEPSATGAAAAVAAAASDEHSGAPPAAILELEQRVVEPPAAEPSVATPAAEPLVQFPAAATTAEALAAASTKTGGIGAPSSRAAVQDRGHSHLVLGIQPRLPCSALADDSGCHASADIPEESSLKGPLHSQLSKLSPGSALEIADSPTSMDIPSESKLRIPLGGGPPALPAPCLQCRVHHLGAGHLPVTRGTARMRCMAPAPASMEGRSRELSRSASSSALVASGLGELRGEGGTDIPSELLHAPVRTSPIMSSPRNFAEPFDSPVHAEIPLESLLQVPVRSSPAMPARFPSHPPLPVAASLELTPGAVLAPLAAQRMGGRSPQPGRGLVRHPRSHSAFVGASRGSPLAVSLMASRQPQQQQQQQQQQQHRQPQLQAPPPHPRPQQPLPQQEEQPDQLCPDQNLSLSLLSEPQAQPPPQQGQLYSQQLQELPGQQDPQPRGGGIRVQLDRPTSLPPIPPQGDGACGWSQHSRSSSGASRRGRGSGGGGGSSRANSAGSEEFVLAEETSLQQEDVASEEPITQLPVRAMPRTVGINHVGLGSSAAEGLAAQPPSASPGQAADQSYPMAGFGDSMPPLDLSSAWQVADELGHTGGMAAPRYLLVRLGECIPAETGAAPVHLSRLDAGTQWRDFLNYGEGRDPGGSLALDELLACPCCLAIFRQPIALPCGHSLCRGCYARISSQPALARRCPLCRADLPQCDLRVNLALGAVCDALRAYRAVSRSRTGHLFIE